jgi:hypothetical protein
MRSMDVCRTRFKEIVDSYCGLCIVGLYFLYLNVVKGALSVFDCSMNKDGAWILDADPSIKCNVVRRRSESRHNRLWRLSLEWELCSPSPFCPHPASRNCTPMCVQVGGIQEAMKPAAAMSLVVYTVGLPASFFTILVVHRNSIFLDQTLREKHLGNTPDTNPNWTTRRRFQELCVLAVVRTVPPGHLLRVLCLVQCCLPPVHSS